MYILLPDREWRFLLLKLNDIDDVTADLAKGRL